MEGHCLPDHEELKELFVNSMTPNEFNPNESHLRKGENAIQDLISNTKRKRNAEPMTPTVMFMRIPQQDESSYDEDNTEGKSSASPAYNPTSPAHSPSTTKSSRKEQIQNPGTSLEFGPGRDPEPAADSESEERSDMSMFMAPVAMNSAQVATSNWMVDSGAGMSGTSSTTNLRDTMRCKIPITPAFGSVMYAISEGLITDPTLDRQSRM